MRKFQIVCCWLVFVMLFGLMLSGNYNNCAYGAFIAGDGDGDGDVGGGDGDGDGDGITDGGVGEDGDVVLSPELQAIKDMQEKFATIPEEVAAIEEIKKLTMTELIELGIYTPPDDGSDPSQYGAQAAKIENDKIVDDANALVAAAKVKMEGIAKKMEEVSKKMEEGFKEALGMLSTIEMSADYKGLLQKVMLEGGQEMITMAADLESIADDLEKANDMLPDPHPDKDVKIKEELVAKLREVAAALKEAGEQVIQVAENAQNADEALANAINAAATIYAQNFIEILSGETVEFPPEAIDAITEILVDAGFPEDQIPWDGTQFAGIEMFDALMNPEAQQEPDAGFLGGDNGQQQPVVQQPVQDPPKDGQGGGDDNVGNDEEIIPPGWAETYPESQNVPLPGDENPGAAAQGPVVGKEAGDGTASGTVNWALDQMTGGNKNGLNVNNGLHTKDDPTAWNNWCLAFVATAWGRSIPDLAAGDAISAYNKCKASGRIVKDRNPPPGAPMFQDVTATNGWGHIFIATGKADDKGDPIIITTGWPGYNGIHLITLSEMERMYSGKYLGWAQVP